MRLFLGLLAVCSGLASPSPGWADTYFQQDVYYTISARLETADHMLTGTARIAYTNNSPDTLRQFYLHLYPNAYRDKNSAFLTSHRRGYNYTLLNLPGAHRSYLEIDSLTVDGRYVQVYVDDTLARFDLPRPLPPGGSLVLDLAFREKIRKHIGRVRRAERAAFGKGSDPRPIPVALLRALDGRRGGAA